MKQKFPKLALLVGIIYIKLNNSLKNKTLNVNAQFGICFFKWLNNSSWLPILVIILHYILEMNYLEISIFKSFDYD